tara:strand:- start:876 stop:1076 length:201 start_codon:yes stop_codon:yes gene_type:complete
MQINLNGEKRTISNSTNLVSLLSELNIDPKKVAVEINLQIIPKSCFLDTKINEGDNIEIVHFIGGG